jgi:hypothetical protein
MEENDMRSASLTRLSIEELQAEAGAALPPKEVLSLLDLNVDLDLALALAAPIDLAVAANANAAVPINAAVSANVLSALSAAGAQSTQDMPIDQSITGDAIANSTQVSTINQPDAGDPGTEPDPVEPGTDDPLASALQGGLLNVDVDVALDADLAAPIAGAVAANANVAAPINASVAANVGAIGSEAIAVAEQTGSITQSIEGTAEANADQTSEIDQSDGTAAAPSEISQ